MENVFEVESDAEFLARVEEFARLVVDSFRPGRKVTVRVRLEPEKHRAGRSGPSVGRHVPTLQHKTPAARGFGGEQTRTAAKTKSPEYRARKRRNQRTYMKRKKEGEAAARATDLLKGAAPSGSSSK
jgi:hypothetical protein